MKWYRSKPTYIDVALELDGLAVEGEASPAVAEAIIRMQNKIGFLEEENWGLVDSAKTMRDNMQNRINALVDEKHRLRIQADACARALRMKQAELAKTLAAFKQLDADYIEACGRLQDAEAKLDGYERAVNSL